jgi:hypothetical protein
MSILDEAFGKETKHDRMRSNLRDAWDHFKWWFLEFGPLIVAIVMIVGCIATGVWAIVWAIRLGQQEEAAWQRFAVEHECKVVAKMRGHATTGTGLVIGADGKTGVGVVTSSTPDKTAYQCNDGVTYWR